MLAIRLRKAAEGSACSLEAVRKVFTVLSEVVGAAKGKLQVIVLDHAPRDVWGGIDNVAELEEWRDGRKLVPVEWVL